MLQGTGFFSHIYNFFTYTLCSVILYFEGAFMDNCKRIDICDLFDSNSADINDLLLQGIYDREMYILWYEIIFPYKNIKICDIFENDSITKVSSKYI